MNRPCMNNLHIHLPYSGSTQFCRPTINAVPTLYRVFASVAVFFVWLGFILDMVLLQPTRSLGRTSSTHFPMLKISNILGVMWDITPSRWLYNINAKEYSYYDRNQDGCTPSHSQIHSQGIPRPALFPQGRDCVNQWWRHETILTSSKFQSVSAGLSRSEATSPQLIYTYTFPFPPFRSPHLIYTPPKNPFTPCT